MPSLAPTTERRGSWICLCPPKAVEFSESTGRLQRAVHSLELQAALHDVDFGGRSREYIILPSGGLVVEVPPEHGASDDGSEETGISGPSFAQVGDTMAAFSGTLTNYGKRS